MTERVTHLNTAIVEKFLYALRDKDFDTISALTGQPTIRLDYTG